MKRLISTLLAVFMIAALICVPVMAEETTNEVLVADTSWYDKDATVLFIEDAADFLGLAEIYASEGDKFAGKTIELTADIDLNPGWDATVTVDATTKAVTLPAAPANVFGGITEFQGTFDGRGHTVKGMYIAAEDIGGAFGFIHKGTGDCVVKNIAFENSLVYASTSNNSNWGMGGVMGTYSDGQGTLLIENVYADINVVNMRKNDQAKNMVGGILGRMETVKKPLFAYDTENTVDVDGDGTVEHLYWVTEQFANVKGCVYAGMIVTMNANKVANNKVLNVSQLVAGTNSQGFATTTGLANETSHESGVNYMWDCVTNSVAMGDTQYATENGGTHEDYGEGKIDFINVIEGAKPQNSTIDATLFKSSTYASNVPAAVYKADLAANAFKWSAEAQAIVPVGVADMLDPNVAAMPNDPSYVPGGSNEDDGNEEEDDDDDGTTVTPPPAETDAPETNATTTAAPAEEESGCASVVGGAAVVMIAMAAAFVCKKKED